MRRAGAAGCGPGTMDTGNDKCVASLPSSVPPIVPPSPLLPYSPSFFHSRTVGTGVLSDDQDNSVPQEPLPPVSSSCTIRDGGEDSCQTLNKHLQTPRKMDQFLCNLFWASPVRGEDSGRATAPPPEPPPLLPFCPMRLIGLAEQGWTHGARGPPALLRALQAS